MSALDASAKSAETAQTGDAGAPVPALLAWVTVAILVLMSIVSFLDRQLVSLMVGPIKDAYHASDSQIGLLQGAAFSAVYAIAAIPFGYAADRFSRRATLFVGVFVWGLAACMCGLAGSFNAMLAARIGVGFGEAALYPVVSSLLSDLFPRHRRAFAFSVVSVGSVIGATGALIIGGAVLRWAGDGVTLPLLGFLPAWKFAFIVTGAPGVILACTVFLMPEPRRHNWQSTREGSVSWKEALAHMRDCRRFYACYLGGFTALGIAGYALIGWTPAVLQRNYGWSPADSGLIAGSLIAACGIIGTLSTGRIVDALFRSGRHDAHALFYAIMAFLYIASGVGCFLAPSAWWFLAVILPTKFVANFMGIATSGLTLVAPPRVRGRVAAIYSLAASALAGAIGPSSVAFMTDVVFRDEAKLQWSVGTVIVVSAALASVMLIMARAPMRKSADQSDTVGRPVAT